MRTLPPLPQTEWKLHMPAAPYEPEWTSTEAGYSEGDMEAYATAAVLAERERCMERVKACLYLDWGGKVLPFGPVLEANAEIRRCVERWANTLIAIRSQSGSEPADVQG